MKYDDLLKQHVGEFGRYHWFALVVLSLTYTDVFHVFLPVFIAMTPPHWCAGPVDSIQNCSTEYRMKFAIPMTCKANGVCSYDPCNMYERNYTHLLMNETLEHQPWNMSIPIYTRVVSGGGGAVGVSGRSLVGTTPFSDSCPLSNETNANMSTVTCTSWNFGDSAYRDNAVTEWGLVCSHKGKAATISGVYMIGRLIGSLTLGPLADIFGRRPVILWTTAAIFILSAGGAFVPNYYVYISLRLVQGAIDNCRSSTIFMLFMELVGSSARIKSSGIWLISWAIGYMFFPLLAYLVRSWRYLQLATAMPEIIVFIAAYIFLPESPRWLLVKGKMAEFRILVTKMAEWNRTVLPETWNVISDNEEGEKGTFLDIMRTPCLRAMTLALSYIFFANCLVYYGLSIGSSSLAGDPFLNCFLCAIVELPGYLFIYTVYEKMNRRPVFALFMLAGGTALLLTPAVPTHLWQVAVTLSLIGKFFISTSFPITFIVAAEVLPTVIRGFGLNVVNSFARIAAILSGYIILLEDVHPSLPVIIFGMSALLAVPLVALLPETKEVFLPQTVEEGEQFLASHACRICGRQHLSDSMTKVDPDGAETKTDLLMTEGTNTAIKT